MFSDATARMRYFATEASLQGYCLEWMLIFRRIQNTENTMSCFKSISDTMRQEKGTSRTEVPV